MSVQIKLSPYVQKYNLGGVMYVQGTEYEMSEADAEVLLNKRTESTLMPYFVKADAEFEAVEEPDDEVFSSAFEIKPEPVEVVQEPKVEAAIKPKASKKAIRISDLSKSDDVVDV